MTRAKKLTKIGGSNKRKIKNSLNVVKMDSSMTMMSYSEEPIGSKTGT